MLPLGGGNTSFLIHKSFLAATKSSHHRFLPLMQVAVSIKMYSQSFSSFEKPASSTNNVIYDLFCILHDFQLASVGEGL